MNAKVMSAVLGIGLVFSCCGAEPTCGAAPVWVKGCAQEMNAMFGFRGDFTAKAGEKVVLRMTGASVYRIYVNGEHAGYGPARGPIGFFRLDEWDVSRFVKDGANAVAVEVSAYNVNNYYIPEQPPFLQAEVLVGGRCALSTPDGFRAVRLPRVQKCSRFSFQRGFGEAYVLGRGCFDWRTGEIAAPLAVERRPGVKLIERRAPYPKFEMTPLVRTAETKVGVDREKKVPPCWFVDRVGVPGRNVKGYPKDELEVNLYEERCRHVTSSVTPASDAASYELKPGTGVLLRADINRTGFVGMKVTVRKPGRLGVVFDELLVDGKVSTTRFSPASVFTYEFREPGEYAIETFEPNVMQWAEAYTLDGEFTLTRPYLRIYRTPAADGAKFASKDPELRRIFEAARETFAQNAVDVFTDCPSRERAGWLCDSYFTAKSSKYFTGKNDLEDLFLENFLLPEKFDIDDGMLPMCYPSDHPNGNYIPNWAMWLVIQLDEYVRERGGDRAMVDRFRPRLVKLVEFLKRYRNSDGLLERLPRWVFVEWSQANKLVQDVNYPSNMTWAEVLDAMDRLYGMPELAAEAKKVRETIRKQSWTGEWFCDNAVRQKDGTLKLSGECTEACQYYAFLFKTATPELHPELWRRLTTDFGPQRQQTKAWPKIWPANAFIGNYVRLEMLSRAGRGDLLENEIRGYFLNMADTTGTLWENDTPHASCNHGFASYVAVLLDKYAK